MKNWTITKWTKEITDDGKDLYTKRKVDGDGETIKFRLLDDDGVIYAYGEMKKEYYDEGGEDEIFEPLDYYMYLYGVTEIQYKINGQYETM